MSNRTNKSWIIVKNFINRSRQIISNAPIIRKYCEDINNKTYTEWYKENNIGLDERLEWLRYFEQHSWDIYKLKNSIDL
jgi:hypothetical protein